MNYFKIGIILILILIILFYTNLNIIILIVEHIFYKITEIKKRELYNIYFFIVFNKLYLFSDPHSNIFFNNF